MDFDNYDIQLIAQSEYKYNPTFYYSDDAAIQEKYKLEKDHLYYCDKNIKTCHLFKTRDDKGSYDLKKAILWVDRRTNPVILDLDIEGGWHAIVDDGRNTLVMLVNTKGPNGEREKRWIKNFRHTANFVSNSELIA